MLRIGEKREKDKTKKIKNKKSWENFFVGEVRQFTKNLDTK